MIDNESGVQVASSCKRVKRYRKILSFTVPFCKELVVLSECTEALEDNTQGALSKEANEIRTKNWITARTRHVPGALLPFHEVYRDYTFDSYTLGEDVANESRFLQLVIETYKDQGISVGRRRVDNRATFTNLERFSSRPSPVGLSECTNTGLLVGV